MRKHIVILFVFLTITAAAQQRPQAQQRSPISLTGTIIDQDTGQPLEYATIVLQSLRNPDRVTGGITDIDGKFDVETFPGRYNLRVEYISYKTIERKDQDFRSSTDLGTITLSMDVSQLEEVEVIAERTTVEVRLDKKIYNVGKDLTNSGATISDALNNIPSVDVDVEGAISLRGNENVRILINGKPSALAGFGSTDALRQLPADAIEKVEVITSPSARYDAEGTAGILNIVLRKEKTLGFNGSANFYASQPISTGVTLNSNLRTDALNLFSTIGYRYSDSPGNAFFDNTYASGNFDRILENRIYNRLDKRFNLNLGLEYYLNDQSSITGAVFYRLSDENDITENSNERFDNNQTQSLTFREEREIKDSDTYQFSLNYVNNFNKDGHKLTADIQYSRDEELGFSEIEENNIEPDTQLIALEQVFEEETENEFLFQADYVLPIGESQFEAGYRGNFEQDITDYQLDSLNQITGDFDTNQDLTNKFTYDENVNAIYTQYGNKAGDFSFLLGLRLENTQLKGKVDSEFDEQALEQQLGIDVDVNFDKNYLGLFPTVNLVYEFAEEESVTLGYNRRINRPRGWYINPFPSRSSRTNIFQGNPDLDPAFSNTLDLGYLKRWNKLTFTSSVYYQKETNSFERIQEETGETTTDGIAIVRSIPINLSTKERYGTEASILFNPSRNLRLNTSFNFYKFISDGIFNGIDYGTENTSYFARFSSKILLPAKINWQTNAFYRGPSNNAQSESKAIFSLNLAFSKDIMSDNATISLNVSDLLNSRKRRSFTETDFFTSRSEFQWRQRQVRISFVYRFNQKKENRGGRNGRGDEDFEFEG